MGTTKYAPTTALACVAARQQAKRLCHCSTKLSYADESTAGLEPAAHGLLSEVCLFYGTCLYDSEATGGEGSELHQLTGDWNRTSDFRTPSPTF